MTTSALLGRRERTGASWVVHVSAAEVMAVAVESESETELESVGGGGVLSPMQMMGIMPAWTISEDFCATTASVSWNSRRRSACPTNAYLHPICARWEAGSSPVYAPGGYAEDVWEPSWTEGFGSSEEEEGGRRLRRWAQVCRVSGEGRRKSSVRARRGEEGGKVSRREER